MFILDQGVVRIRRDGLCRLSGKRRMTFCLRLTNLQLFKAESITVNYRHALLHGIFRLSFFYSYSKPSISIVCRRATD